VYSQCSDCSTTVVYQKTFALDNVGLDHRCGTGPMQVVGRGLNRANERYQRKTANAPKDKRHIYSTVNGSTTVYDLPQRSAPARMAPETKT
jgi:hypothetical protein